MTAKVVFIHEQPPDRLQQPLHGLSTRMNLEVIVQRIIVPVRHNVLQKKKVLIMNRIFQRPWLVIRRAAGVGVMCLLGLTTLSTTLQAEDVFDLQAATTELSYQLTTAKVMLPLHLTRLLLLLFSSLLCNRSRPWAPSNRWTKAGTVRS